MGVTITDRKTGRTLGTSGKAKSGGTVTITDKNTGAVLGTSKKRDEDSPRGLELPTLPAADSGRATPVPAAANAAWERSGVSRNQFDAGVRERHAARSLQEAIEDQWASRSPAWAQEMVNRYQTKGETKASPTARWEAQKARQARGTEETTDWRGIPLAQSPDGVRREPFTREEPTILDRAKATLSGAAKSYGASLANAQANVYDLSQGTRDAMNRELLEGARLKYDQALRDYRETEALAKQYPDDRRRQKDLEASRNVLEAAERELAAYGMVPKVQRGATEQSYQASDRLAMSGQADVERAKAGLGGLGRFAVDVGMGGAQLGADIAGGIATGGGTMLPLLLRSYGGGAQEARQEGASTGQAAVYGAASALTEALTEKISSLGNIQTKAFGSGALDDILEGVVGAVERIGKTEAGRNLLNRAASAGVGFLSEGAEEFVSGVVSPLLKKGIYAQGPIDWKGVMEDAAYEFLVGGGIGVVSGGLGGTNTREVQSQYLSGVTERAQNDAYAAMAEKGVFSQEGRQAARDALGKMDKAWERTGKEIPGLRLPGLEDIRAEQAAQAAIQEKERQGGIETSLKAQTGLESTERGGSGAAAQVEAQKNTARGAETAEKPRISMADFTDNTSPVWRQVDYNDTETQTAVTQNLHKEMVDAGEVVRIPESTMQRTAEAYPDLRGMKKREREPVLRAQMNTLKSSLRQFLNGLKGTGFEFEVDGGVLEARLYNTGIREVMEKITRDKASMFYHSDDIFRNAKYLYSTQDYDGDPNVYRWNYFYSPVQIGDETVGVRIAVRDMVPSASGVMDSQIYNWGIKKAPSLDGGGPGKNPNTTGVSSEGAFAEGRASASDGTSALSGNLDTVADAGAGYIPQESLLSDGAASAVPGDSVSQAGQDVNQEKTDETLGENIMRQMTGGFSAENRNIATVDRRLLENLGRITRSDIRLVSQDELDRITGQRGADGVQMGNQLYISSDAQRPMLEVAKHEITHRLQDLAPAEYAAFRDYVAGVYQAEGSLKGYIQGIRERRARAGVELTEAEALDEIAADYAGELMVDEKAVRKLAGENRGLLERLLDGLREIIGRIRRTMAGEADAETAELERAARLWEDALRSAGESEEPEGLRLRTVDVEAKPRFSFGGRNARQADSGSLTRAQLLESRGTAAEDIRQDTGWFRGMDGKWRFEIDDTGMEYSQWGDMRRSDRAEYARFRELEGKFIEETITEAEQTELRGLLDNGHGGGRAMEQGTLRLADYIRHDELFRNYPQLKGAALRFAEMEPGAKGSYNPETNTITVSEELRDAPEETIIHEVQHAIQTAEGFARGSSPDYWRETRRAITETIRSARENLDLWLNDIGYNEYTKKSIGEVVNKQKTLEQHWEDLQRFKDDSPYGRQIRRCEEELRQYQEQYDRITRGMTPTEQYWNTAGEIEARDAANRRNLTEEERRDTPPDLGGGNTVFAEDSGENASIGYDEANKPFVTVEEDILEGVPREDWVRTVKDNLRKKFPNGVTVGNSEIEINKRSRGEMTLSRYMKWLSRTEPQLFADKLRATSNADEILRATTGWVNEALLHPRNDAMIDFARGTIQLRVGGNDYTAQVIVGGMNDGRMVLYDVINLEPASIQERTKKTAAGETDNPTAGTGGRKPATADHSISRSSSDVKPARTFSEEMLIYNSIRTGATRI